MNNTDNNKEICCKFKLIFVYHYIFLGTNKKFIIYYLLFIII